ncbi:hypothetical protein [Glycomyces paridis]|uniref:Integral membrane protein n=1 Tax=Glycomyces paridis TaxID=2126555 RepID=A0A4S8P0Y2_9ACTN|nr:hypothetical protein [Glycomyces paridis]THV23588.1 hypothetical protein E9998_22595 [Glycomyces paridis]
MDETPADAPETAAARRHGVGRLVRWIVALLACVLAAVAVTGAVAAYYARLELLDTDRFTERTEVIAADEQVQNDVADLLSARIIAAIDIEQVAEDAAGWAGGEDPPAAVRDLIASAAESLRGYIENEVADFVSSDAFLDLWDAAVREAHASLVSALRGENAGAVLADGNTLSLDLGRVVAVIKERLVDADFALAEDIPAVEAQYVLVDSEQVPQLQRDTERLEWAATWLPWIAVGLLIVAFVLAPRRWVAALVVGALGAVLAVAALWGLAEGRTLFVSRARDAAFAPLTYDAFTDDLQWTYGLMLVVAVLLAALAVLMLIVRRRSSATEPAEA